MEAKRVDPHQATPEEMAESMRQAQVLFKLNHTMPFTEEYDVLVRELFGEGIGSGVRVMPGLTGVCFNNVNLADNVLVMNNCLMMGRGGITVEEGAMIAANVQLISNNHDPYDLPVLLALLCASGQLPAVDERFAFIGELSLDGQLRPVTGVLPMALAAVTLGVTELFLPAENAAEAAEAALTVYPARSASDVVRHVLVQRIIAAYEKMEHAAKPAPAPAKRYKRK